MFPWGRLFKPSAKLIVGRRFGDVRATYVPFNDVLKQRQCQAKKSILVQVNSELSFPELHTYCSQFGSIIGVHHYTISNNQQHFMLVEFKDEAGAAQLLSSVCFMDDLDIIPVQSPFMWFRPSYVKNGKKLNKLIGFMNAENGSANLNLSATNGSQIPNEKTILKALTNSKDLSEQMTTLFNMTCLNDLGIRLRYIAARQIERAFTGLYPSVSVNPFGSTVNGFGKLGCDLDLVMKLTPNNIEDDLSSRLVFHTKKSIATGRLQQQRFMEIISDMIQLFVPGCSRVRRILQARVPIIKYNQDYADLECDLSMNSLSGVYMSELLYLYGSFDSRVRPLVFTIRKWAQLVGLTNPSPGKWITNFPLTLMVLFFLQNAKKGPILPSFNYLKKLAGEDDVRITDDHVNCTFLRDIRNIAFKTENDSNLEELLLEFFEYYSSFEFTIYGLSINEGRPVNKIDYSGLYIINPLETSLNVSKNVSFEECERIKVEFRNAVWLLESCSNRVEDDVWGLSALLQKHDKNSSKYKVSLPQRLVSVKDLFLDSDDKPDVAIVSQESKSSSAPNLPEEGLQHLRNELLELKLRAKNTKNVLYKNISVKNQVQAIKTDEITSQSNKSNSVLNNITKGNQSGINRRRVRRR